MRVITITQAMCVGVILPRPSLGVIIGEVDPGVVDSCALVPLATSLRLAMARARWTATVLEKAILGFDVSCGCDCFWSPDLVVTTPVAVQLVFVTEDFVSFFLSSS